MDNKRITIIDGFRVIAILVVLLYHYFLRYDGDKYEYKFNTEVFNFGRFGLHFLFIISGFVIILTLKRCSGFVEFIKKRFLRLIPGMLVCSVVTYLIFINFDKSNLFAHSHSFLNLLFSNTFMSPELFNIVFSTDLQYIAGAYWSLWVEVCFYFVVSFLYFMNKAKFIRNYTLFTIFSLAAHYVFISSKLQNLVMPIIGEEIYLNVRTFVKIFNFMGLSGWFLLGIILYELYLSKSRKYLLFFTVVFLLQFVLMPLTLETSLFMCSIFSLLILFIYKPQTIQFLGNKFLSRLALVSYSVYLIHENIGVLIINKSSLYFGNYNWMIPLFLIAFFFLFAILSYKYLETPLNKILKKIIFK